MKVICETCDGTGQRDITGVYEQTYKTLRRLCRRRKYVVAGRDANVFGCEPTALNNRLAWLEEHGLAVSERFGRERRFRAI